MPAGEIQRVNWTAINVEHKQYIVSTISLPGRAREEYETMVFLGDGSGEVADWTDMDCRRCCTLEEALTQHEQVCEDWKKGR